MTKESKQDKDFNEIFRKKLENYEITPSFSFEEKLMKRVGRQEFMRFNALKFNIWYAGALVAAGAALVIMLLSGSDPDDVTSGSLPKEQIESPSVYLSDEPAAVQKTETGPAGASVKVQVLNENLVKPAITLDPARVEPEIEENKSAQEVIDQINASNLPAGDVNPGKTNEKGYLKKSGSVITVSASEGCVPLKVKFSSNSLRSDSCRWVFGDGGSSKDKEPEWIFDEEGEYKVVLTIKGADGSQSSVSTVITVHPRPVARFEITPDNVSIPQDQVTFLNFSTGAVKYKWDFGDGVTSDLFEPSYSYSKYGKYNVSLTAISEFGCSHTLTVKNAFTGSVNQINFPNAFIPNTGGATGGYYSPTSDEAALIFHPVFKGVSEYQLRIFSRRGVLIFESNDLYVGWDGYYNGQICDPGVYVWKVRGTFINGEPFTKMGDVTILRN